MYLDFSCHSLTRQVKQSRLQAPNVTLVGVIALTGWATVGHSTCLIKQQECRFNYPGDSKVV